MTLTRVTLANSKSTPFCQKLTLNPWTLQAGCTVELYMLRKLNVRMKVHPRISDISSREFDSSRRDFPFASHLSISTSISLLPPCSASEIWKAEWRRRIGLTEWVDSLESTQVKSWFKSDFLTHFQAVEKRTSKLLLYSWCMPESVCKSAAQQKKWPNLFFFPLLAHLQINESEKFEFSWVSSSFTWLESDNLTRVEWNVNLGGA